MEQTISYTLIRLKKELSKLISQNHYDLLSPEILALSREIDRLMLPIFEIQLDDSIK